jgi:DNA repair protein RecN (Recombination protein N)
MLTQLRIRNFALLEEVELEFGPGFNVLTGETGAGKSILIDAINAVLGGRSGPEWLRTGADRATIEAVFEVANVETGRRGDGATGGGDGATEVLRTSVSPSPRLPIAPSSLLEEWVEDGLLILSRDLTRAGKSQCRVNGRICTASTVREVAAELIDLHGQHEHQSLLVSERHVDLLDAWAGPPVLNLRRRAEAEYAAWQAVRRDLEALRTNERDRARQLDLYQFQIEEIDGAQMTPGEEEELAADRLRLGSAEKLHAASASALQSLAEDQGAALDLLAAAAREVDAAAALDAGLAPIAESLQTALIAAQDAVSELRAYQESVEFNPERLEQVQDRLDMLRRLKKKYGDTLEEVLEYRQRIGEELHALTHSEERMAALEAELARRGAAMDQLATDLCAARRAAAAEFERRLVAELVELSMQHTRFEVRIEPPTPAAALGVGGIPAWLGQVEFLISPNPGEPVRPLARIASGGEMSRIMLALKSVMAGVSAVPTLIFDEIDAGVGGRTAEVLGEKMAALSRSAQVLCVTHLPQIAGMATHHFQVQKRVAAERTWVEVLPLKEAERVDELARMLGGKEETAARHARELLASGKKAGVQVFRCSGVQESTESKPEHLNTRTPEHLNGPKARRRA